MGYKMKGFSGFGNSPIKQKGFVRTPDDFDHGKAKADAKKRVAEQKARDMKTAKMNKIKSVGKNVAKGAGRLLGVTGVATTMYDMYKSGRKHSGGKINPNQKSIMSEGKKKTKSIFNNKK
tara:strand:- start:33 stop:392 length:360 start_codon:yes stop_codon:yes gene_type:complete